jgi:large subunit ribosomal protein L9
VKANVARSPDEAELQRQGINVIDQQFADDEAEAAAANEEFLETQAEATAEQDDGPKASAEATDSE